jgi:hypothetical protein
MHSGQKTFLKQTRSSIILGQTQTTSGAGNHSALFGFFSKAFMVHFLKDKSEAGAVREMGGHPF